MGRWIQKTEKAACRRKAAAPLHRYRSYDGIEPLNRKMECIMTEKFIEKMWNYFKFNTCFFYDIMKANEKLHKFYYFNNEW